MRTEPTERADSPRDIGRALARLGFGALVAGLLGLGVFVVASAHWSSSPTTDAKTRAFRFAVLGLIFIVPFIAARRAAFGTGGRAARGVATVSTMVLAVFFGMTGMALFSPAALFMFLSAVSPEVKSEPATRA